MSDRITTGRSLVSLGIMMLLSGAAVMTAGFALPPDAQLAALGQIGACLLLTGTVIYLAGLWRAARQAHAAARAQQAASGETAAQTTPLAAPGAASVPGGPVDPSLAA